MLHYLAITLPELLAGTPPQRETIPVAANAQQFKVSGEDQSEDELLEEVRDEAAFQSLQLAVESGDVPLRLVASAELGEQPGLLNSWNQVDSFYCDDVEGRELAELLAKATTQEEADSLAERLVEEPLMWFDSSEREDLGHRLSATEPTDEI